METSIVILFFACLAVLAVVSIRRSARFRSNLSVALALLIVMLIGLSVGTGGDEALSPVSTGPVAHAGSELEREGGAEVDPVELDRLVTGNNVFAFDLYHGLGDADGNIFFSPYSLSQMLAMVYAGARGETERQMASVLHLPPDQASTHRASNALDLALAPESDTDDGFQFENANAIWGQQGNSFESAYLDVLARYYGAAMQLVDFTDSGSARAAINDWVREQTNGRIAELIPAGQPATNTKLILTNAIYFHARWAKPFNEHATRMETFTRRDGREVAVPMMHQTATYRTMADDDFEAIDLPYAGGSMSMLVILPDRQDFDGIERRLSPEFIAGVTASMSGGKTALSFPRFEFDSTYDLDDTLRDMGMPDAFSNRANFSGMTGEMDLRIDRVDHKAFISVDEKSTEAAAASGGAIVLSSGPRDFDVDRPFIFLIRDDMTGAILFVGRVDDPTE